MPLRWMSVTRTTCHDIACSSTECLILVAVHGLDHLIVSHSWHLRLSLMHISFAKTHQFHGLLRLLGMSSSQESCLAPMILATCWSTCPARTSPSSCSHHLLLRTGVRCWLSTILLGLHVVVLTAASQGLQFFDIWIVESCSSVVLRNLWI